MTWKQVMKLIQKMEKQQKENEKLLERTIEEVKSFK